MPYVYVYVYPNVNNVYNLCPDARIFMELKYLYLIVIYLI